MDAQPGNTLNRSMSSLWTAHRRTRLNLNGPLAVAPVQTPTGDDLANLEPASQPAINLAEVPQTDRLAPAIPPPETPNAPEPRTSKRKVRVRTETSETDHDNSSGGKRAKLAGGAIAKDYTPPSVRLADLGGVDEAVEKMLELVAMPLCHPEIYVHTGVHPPRGVLLHGPPGCGKTLLANAIAGEIRVPFINISAPSIVSGMSGESEKTLRDTFEEAKRIAPCILFIDEIDAITPKRENAQREMERRIVAQFLTCMDELAWEKTDNKPVVVIGATNRPDSLDAALRRAGRFDHEVAMGVPNDEARAQIIRVMCSKLRLQGDFDFLALAKVTPGYVGADLAALTGAAGIIAVKRIFERLSSASPVPEVAEETTSMVVDADSAAPMADGTEVAAPITQDFVPKSAISRFLTSHPGPLSEAELEPLHVSFEDFISALQEVQPSAKREGFATVPDITWADVGALNEVRDELHMAIVQPIRRPELFARVGVQAPCGVLLWGPPGCGKTLLAKAVANESAANFISVKGPELLNKYVGESERAVRQVFARARASSPCVIFFDELDALVPRREDSMSEASARVVNTLLTELDGLDTRKSVYVLAATNRPDMIDPAMCRPGRLDKLLYVDLPSASERIEIVRTLIRTIPIGSQEHNGQNEAHETIFRMVQTQCDGYSGADLAALVREASVIALRRTLGNDLARDGPKSSAGAAEAATEEILVGHPDFTAALKKVRPSVSAIQRRRYETLRSKFAGMPVRAGIRETEEVDGPKPGPVPPTGTAVV